ncbi:hypothetical protein [Alkalicoccus chagannorensis]|uniref:hypothetical protein n=1 Tax=Alkalicoccus chagannorensis TaxID=427072 RepID=UPI00040EF681|nr:hypothetical protein [Alkalicoccus chagannorensis]
MGLALDAPEESDIIEEVNGVQVAFDKMVHEHTQDLELAYQETSDGGGLVMNNGGSECC